MYDGITTDIDCDGIDIAVISNLDVSEVEVPSLDEVEVNRPCRTVARYRDVLDVGIPGQTDQQSVYGACSIVDTGTPGGLYGDVWRTRAVLGGSDVVAVHIAAQCQLVDKASVHSKSWRD